MQGRSRLRLSLALVLGVLAVGAFGLLRSRGDEARDTASPAPPRPQASTVVRGTLTVGVDTSVPPFAFPGADGPTGFDVELLQAAAPRMGLEVRTVEDEVAALLQRLEAGELDVVAGGLPGTAETEQWGDLSEPTFVARQALVTDPEARPDIEGVEDLAPGERVGVARGTAGETWALGNLPPRAIEVLAYEDADEAAAAAARGDLTAALVDELTAQGGSFDIGGLEVVQTFATGQHLAFAVQPENPGLLDALDAALQELIEDGTYDEVYGRYAGALPPGGRVTESAPPLDLPG